MSINDVSLFGTLVEDVVPRKNNVGQPFAIFRVRTYKFIRDRLTGQPREHSVVHEVQCYDEASIGPLGVHGKAGAWVRVRGEVAYKENREMFVRVPMRGGMAIVSAYFGTGITPSNPYRPSAASEPGEASREASQSTRTSGHNEQIPPTTASQANGPEAVTASVDNENATETTKDASFEAEQSHGPAAAATSALDELHADAGGAAAQGAATAPAQNRPTAPPPRPSLPGLRKPLTAPAASAPQAQPASSASGASSASAGGVPRPAAPPPRPSAPPPKQASAFPSRLPSGMPRPAAPAPQGTRPPAASANKSFGPEDIPF